MHSFRVIAEVFYIQKLNLILPDEMKIYTPLRPLFLYGKSVGCTGPAAGKRIQPQNHLAQRRLALHQRRRKYITSGILSEDPIATGTVLSTINSAVNGFVIEAAGELIRQSIRTWLARA
ncbi:hypothetical protein POKO110462_15095 [Pontibacter korlensis]